MNSAKAFTQQWIAGEAARMAVSAVTAIVDMVLAVVEAKELEAMADDGSWIVSERSGAAIDAELEARPFYGKMAAYGAAAGLSAEAVAACIEKAGVRSWSRCIGARRGVSGLRWPPISGPEC